MAWGRVFKKGDNWYTDVRHHGQRRRKKIGKNRVVAEKILQKILGDLVLNDHGIMQDEKITVKKFAPDYLASKKQTLRPRSYVRVEGIMRGHLLRAFGHLFLYDLGPEKFYAYQSKRLSKGISNASLNRELSVMKNMLTTAVQWKKLKVNPLQGVGLLKEPPGRVRFLNLEEINRLLNACPPPPHPLRSILLVAFLTGMRRNEILTLRWEYVKLDNRMIVLPTSKSNTVRVIYFNETLYDALAAMPDKTGYVFPGSNGKPLLDMKRSFHTACKKAGVENFRFHDCRHTYASHMTMMGVQTRVLQDLLGHKNLSMTQRYSHLAPAAMQGAVKLLDGIIDQK